MATYKKRNQIKAVVNLSILLFLIIITLIGLLVVNKKINLFSRANKVKNQLSVINKPLGLGLALKNGFLQVSWTPIKNNRSLVNFAVVVRNLDTQVIPKGGRVQVGKDDSSVRLANLTLDKTHPNYSVTLRAIFDASKTVYVETKNFKYENGQISLLPPQTTDQYFDPFGIGGYTDINKTGNTKYSDWYYRSGAKISGVSVRWDKLEPVKGGGYNFSAIGATEIHDKWCNKDGYQCRLLFGTSPDWAKEKATANNVGYTECAPLDPDDFDAMAQAAAAVVERLGENSVGIEIYNEPDFAWCYGGKDDANSNSVIDYQDFAHLMKKTYEAIKRVNPNYPVLMSRFATDPSWNIQHTSNNKDRTGGKESVNLTDFLEQVLSYSQRNLGGQYFDVLDMHYYDGGAQYSFGPFKDADPYVSRGGIRGKTIWARNLMNTYGAQGKPIFYSEMGYIASPKDDPVQKTNQANGVFKLYAQGFSAGAASMSWFCLADQNCQGTDSNTSLLDAPANFSSITPRPSFTAYQTISRELTNVTFNTLDYSSGIEGYIFISNDLVPQLKEVLWSTSPAGAKKNFPTKKIEIIYPDGRKEVIDDNKTGDQDRKKNSNIEITVTKPVIVSWF